MKFRIEWCVLGRGLFATHLIKAEEKILRFEGPIITFQQTLEKNEKEGDALQIGANHYLDTKPPGLFVNHSCEPNAGVARNRTLIALTDILPGQQICFDYSTMMDEEHWTMPCRCGSRHCRHLIQDFKYLPGHLRNHYLSVGIVPKFIQDTMQSANSPNGQNHHPYSLLIANSNNNNSE